MQLTLAAGFVPFSSVLNTVLVLSVVRGRGGGRTGRRRAGRAGGRVASAAPSGAKPPLFWLVSLYLEAGSPSTLCLKQIVIMGNVWVAAGVGWVPGRGGVGGFPGVAPPGGGRFPAGAGAGSAGRECPPPTGTGTRGCWRLRQVTGRRFTHPETRFGLVCVFFLVCLFLKPFRRRGGG